MKSGIVRVEGGEVGVKSVDVCENGDVRVKSGTVRVER